MHNNAALVVKRKAAKASTESSDVASNTFGNAFDARVQQHCLPLGRGRRTEFGNAFGNAYETYKASVKRIEELGTNTDGQKATSQKQWMNSTSQWMN